MIHYPHISTLFPYTTLFRSQPPPRHRAHDRRFFYETISATTTCHHPSCGVRSEEHTSELQSRFDLVCRLLLEKKNRWRCGCVNPMPPGWIPARSNLSSNPRE